MLNRMRRAFFSAVVGAVSSLYIYAIGKQGYGEFGFGNGNFTIGAPPQKLPLVMELNSSSPQVTSVPWAVGETIYQGSSLGAATAVGTFLAYGGPGGYDTILIVPISGTWATAGSIIGVTNTTPMTYSNATILPSPPNMPDTFAAIDLRFQTTMLLKADGSLFATGNNQFNQIDATANTTIYSFTSLSATKNFVAIAPGDEFVAALDANGAIWARGRNEFGQCHTGNLTSPVTTLYNTNGCPLANHPVEVSFTPGSGTFTPGELFTGAFAGRFLFKDSTRGVMSISNLASGVSPTTGTITGSSSGATATITSATATRPVWKYLNVGHRWLGAIDTNGYLYTWGNNGGDLECGRPSQLTSGQPDYVPNGNGTNDTNCRPVNYPSGGSLPYPGKWLAIYPGAYHGMALSTDGNVYAWGQNSHAQLGANAPLGYVSGNPPFAVPCPGTGHHWISGDGGDYHCGLIRDDGTLWMSGGNGKGQCGTTTNAGSAPQETTATTDFAQVANPVIASVTGYWTAVSCGDQHTLAIDNLGNLWGWGDNSSFQLGRITSGSLAAGSSQQAGSNVAVPTLLDSSRVYTAVSAGYACSLALAKT